MSVFGHHRFDDHEQVCFFSDASSGLRAIVAIHRSAPLGFAGGGCRMWPYANDDEALEDALRLSRAMTYKHALADTPAGGGKAVVIGDPRRDKSEALWRALGRAVEGLGGRYIIGKDVGTTSNDLRIVGEETKYVVGRRQDSAPVTAYGVLVGLRTAVKRRLPGRTLAGLRVAVQGAGRVGTELCRLLAREGARLWVADVDEQRARAVAAEVGAEVVEPDRIHRLEVDVFAPCALGSVLNSQTIPELRCAVIAGAANNQLADEARDGEALARRGILYAPDFVINMGGMLAAAQEGLQLARIEPEPIDSDLVGSQVQRIADLLERVFDRAGEGNTDAAAVRMARDKLREMGA